MLDDEGSNDLELDVKNNEFENNLFSKFDTTVKLDDSSDDENARMKPSSATITKSKSTAQSKPKIVIKVFFIFKCTYASIKRSNLNIYFN